jgi:hypothetical protein
MSFNNSNDGTNILSNLDYYDDLMDEIVGGY